jgi:hypothetical protein
MGHVQFNLSMGYLRFLQDACGIERFRLRFSKLCPKQKGKKKEVPVSGTLELVISVDKLERK